MGTVLLCLLILTLAAFAQTVSGFGFALAAVPLLSLVIDPVSAVVTATLGSTLVCAVTAWAQRREIDRRSSLTLALSALAGMPFGLLCLRLLPGTWLRAAIALAVVSCLLLVWLDWRMPFAAWRVGAAGIVSGVMLTATGTNGPPIVAALQALGLEPARFRATLAATFTLCGIVAMAGFLAAGVVSREALQLNVIGLVAIGAGGWAGQRMFTRLNPTVFRRIVLVALIGCAAAAIVNAALS